VSWASVSASSAWTKVLSAGPTDPDNNIQVNTAAYQHYNFFKPGSGRYLIIAPERDGSNNDYFKLQSLVIEQLPPSEVPAPGSMGLLTLGSVIGLLFVRRLPNT
jgi:hypothetical protein